LQNDKNHKLFDKYACQKEKDVLQCKGNIEMSRLLQELIGKNPTIVGQVFGTSLWEVVDVDEEWVKLRHVDKMGKKNSSCNVLRISKLLNLTESRCVTCN